MAKSEKQIVHVLVTMDLTGTDARKRKKIYKALLARSWEFVKLKEKSRSTAWSASYEVEKSDKRTYDSLIRMALEEFRLELTNHETQTRLVVQAGPFAPVISDPEEVEAES